MNFEKADNGNLFDKSSCDFYADNGFGDLVRVSDWPAMNHSSLSFSEDYGF